MPHSTLAIMVYATPVTVTSKFCQISNCHAFQLMPDFLSYFFRVKKSIQPQRTYENKHASKHRNRLATFHISSQLVLSPWALGTARLVALRLDDEEVGAWGARCPEAAGGGFLPPIDPEGGILPPGIRDAKGSHISVVQFLRTFFRLIKFAKHSIILRQLFAKAKLGNRTKFHNFRCLPSLVTKQSYKIAHY